MYGIFLQIKEVYSDKNNIKDYDGKVQYMEPVLFEKKIVVNYVERFSAFESIQIRSNYKNGKSSF